MRRSSVVRLTLLPTLATAVAAADPPTVPIEIDPHEQPAPVEPPDEPQELSPPGMTPERLSPPGLALPLSPPGLTPTIWELSCDEDPRWQLRTDCVYDHGVIRGGFGGYFLAGGG